MSEIVENAPLPRVRRALAQARRQLDDLEQAREDVEKYRDLLPYVLDRLLNVWRVIDTESRGRRPQAFSTWWLNQKDGNRSSVARLRNHELKANQQSAKQEKFFRGENSIRVLENGKVEAVRPDGTISPLLPDGTVDAGEMVWQKTRWEFIVPGLEGREAREVLELVYMKLKTEVLPEAERLVGKLPSVIE